MKVLIADDDELVRLLMKVLIADDDELVRLLLSRFVENLGHRVVLANDGMDAVACYRRELPDLVLMDILMPNMDGIEASQQIKNLAGQHWVPIILVTHLDEYEKLANAIEIGADDYLLKPINFRILEAKIKAVNRTIGLNRKVRKQSAALAVYYDRTEQEKQLARELIEKMVNPERLSDPCLHYWITPAESLPGDLIAVARTPSGVLHLLLADGIGHGLNAALNVLPLTQPFYAMTARGFDLVDIVWQMHKEVRQLLPSGRFIALAMLSIDFSNGHIDIWNGGIPDILLFDDQGCLLNSWPSRHLPLGILANEAVDLSCDYYRFNQPLSLLVHSDGLLEARNPNGENFGRKRLIAAMLNRSNSERLATVVDALQIFLAGKPQHDDVSIALVDISIQPQRRALMIRPAVVDLAQVAEKKWHYALSLSAEQLRDIQLIPLLMTFINQLSDLSDAQADVFVIVTALVNNALDYGLLKLTPGLSADKQNRQDYLQTRRQRLAALVDGWIEVELLGQQSKSGFLLSINVTDSGEGFDWQRYMDVDLTTYGNRGIGLIRALCQAVHYCGDGHRAEVIYQVNGLKACIEIMDRKHKCHSTTLHREEVTRHKKAALSTKIKRRRCFSDYLIVIGSSTGGTEALKQLLSAWSTEIPAIMIVQHMVEKFTRPFAKQLNNSCDIHVKEAESGEPVLPGHAYIAPGDSHLLVAVEKGRFVCQLSKDHPVNRHRPSVDVLFRSAADCVGKLALGIILTGMGKDGAFGLLEMKRAGSYNFAQDEASCAVFGMPKEAINLGAVDEVVPLSAMASRVLKKLEKLTKITA